MNEQQISSSANLLRIVRDQTDAIGVAVSFGKDSLATLDLCCAMFKRVEGYYLFRVRDMGIVKGWAEDAKRRWGITVRMYPHFDLSRCYKNAVLQPHWGGLDKTPTIDLLDIETAFRNDANVDWIALGWRRNDSFSRALIMKKCGGIDHKSRRVFPLRSWRRADVYEYLECRKIPLPPTLGRKEQGGLDFHPGAIEAIKREYPEDYERWLRDFPFAGLQAAGQTSQVALCDTALAVQDAPARSAPSTTAPRRKAPAKRKAKQCR